MIVLPYGTWLDIFMMLSRSKLDLFRTASRTFADMIESGAKSLPLYPPSYLEIYGPCFVNGEGWIFSTAENPSFWKPIDNDSGMTPQIIEEYIYPSPKFKVMQEWDIENPDHHLFEGQRIPQTFLDDYAGWDMNTWDGHGYKWTSDLKSDEHYTAALVMSSSGKKSIVAMPKPLEINRMEHTKESDVKPEYYHICNHLFILESRGGPAVESARTKANLALNGDDFHRTQDETFYHAVKSHCFTGIYLNVIPFSAEFLESFHQFVIKPLAMDSGKRNYRVDEICFDRCSFILESTIQPFLRLLSQPLPLTKMYISQMFGVSSSTFLDSVLNSPALICTSRVILIMDCVFSSATFSDDDVVLAFIFGDNFNGACRQYFASLDQPNETLRQDFLLWDWQPGEKFLAKAIQKFFAKAPLLYQTVLPVTKSIIRLPGSRMPNFVSSFLRNEFQNCLQEFNCAHDSSERDSYEFTEESNRKPARVKVDGRPYAYGIEQNVLTTEYTLRWKPRNGLGTVCMHILVNEDDERRKWPNLPHPICRIGPKFTHEIHVKFSDC